MKKGKDMNSELEKAVLDVLCGTPLDEFGNRDDDGMIAARMFDQVTTKDLSRWIDRLKAAYKGGLK